MMRLPDVEAMLVKFLAPIDVQVGTKIPNPRPASFIRLVRTGGAASNRVVETVNITVTCEAASSVDANELAAKARQMLLNEYTRMPLVRGIREVTGPYYNPDPDTNRDRYTFTVALIVRATRTLS